MESSVEHCISADDARAIDVKYHLYCWVQHVQLGNKGCSEQKEHALEETNIAIVASDIELINLVRALLQTGEVLTMTDLKSVYSKILQNNGAPDKQPSTSHLKEKITFHVDNVHSMKAKRRNESDRLYSPPLYVIQQWKTLWQKQQKAAFTSCLILPLFSELPLLVKQRTLGNFKENSQQKMLWKTYLKHCMLLFAG